MKWHLVQLLQPDRRKSVHDCSALAVPGKLGPVQWRCCSTGPRILAQGWGRCSGRRQAGAVATVSGQAGEAPTVHRVAVAVVQ